MILKIPQLHQFNPFPQRQYLSPKLKFLKSLKILFPLLMFSFVTLNIAQVKIKERIEIKPEFRKSIEKSLSKTQDSGHSLRAVHIWDQTYLGDNNDIPMSRMRFRIKAIDCNQTVYSDYDYSGNLEFTLTELKGTAYNIELLLSQRTVWDPIYRGEYLHGAGFQVYVDDEYATTGYNSAYVKPWFAYLHISITGREIFYNDYGNDVDLYVGTDCKPIIGYLHKDWPTLTIIKGQEYISFYDEVNDDTLGNSFYSGDYLVNNEFPKIIYNEPYLMNEPLLGIVKAEVNGVEAYDTLEIMKFEDLELNVQIIPEDITPGGESDIILKESVSDDLVDFDSDQLFKVQIIDGAEYGTILSSNGTDTSDSFSEIEQGFKFVASSEIEFDSVEVLIKVSANIIADEEVLAKVDNNSLISDVRKETNTSNTINENEILVDTDYLPQNESFIFIPPDEDREIFGVGSVKIKKENIEIMLGETKYFGVKKNKDKEEYKIAEIVTTYGEKPVFTDDKNEDWKWIKDSTVWGNDPIEKLGTKSGVYWEKKYPVLGEKKYEDGVYIGKKLEKMEILPSGIIRISGRFWEDGKVDSFKVKLKSIKNLELEVKVIKPKELGDKNHKPKIVTGKKISIDSVCIVTAGILGIPPQIIKGQMHKETSFRNSFRYEPRIDINVQKNIKKKKKYIDDYDYYTVSSKNMGTIEIPSSHTNVRPVPYIKSPKKISDYLIENINSYIHYPESKDDKPYFVGFEKGLVTMELKKEYGYACSKLKKSKDDATDYAKEKIKKWLKTDNFSDKDKYQQSRIFSSYGMLQQVFYFALDPSIAGYSISNNKQSPESLNEIKNSIKAYRAKMEKELEKYSGNEWENGFEQKMIEILQNYNSGEKEYGIDVHARSILYFPKK